MSGKRRRQLSINRVEEDLDDMVTRELGYAAFQCGGFGVTEDDIYEPLIYGERDAIAPLCRKLIELVRRQQEAQGKGETKPVKGLNVLSPLVSGYLAQQLLERCARAEWRLPPELLRLTSVLLKADRFSVRNPNLEEWPLSRERAHHFYKRSEGTASARKIAKWVGRSHVIVAKWLKQPDFVKLRAKPKAT